MRVLHFVTGGFSGATQVAIDLCQAGLQSQGWDVMLVLRRKRSTDMKKIAALRAQGIQVRVVSNWLHVLTVWELRRIIRNWKPDVVFAHGFSDHIWGRKAAVAEGVRRIYHVEHNSRERYTRRRLYQSLELAHSTQASIGVSEGVRQSLINRGFPPSKCLAIPNGIALEKFPEEKLPELFQAREPAIIMAARFARQKDHATLIHALALLRERGITPMLYLAGSGKPRLMSQTRRLTHRLGVQQQVHFLGQISDLHERLFTTQIFVLSTRWEGMPLALVEAMAAGCACIATDVLGAREVIDPGHTGLLVPPSDAASLADALQQLLQNTDLSARLGCAARRRAFSTHGRDLMWERYAALIRSQNAL